jgi:hypothetical protein
LLFLVFSCCRRQRAEHRLCLSANALTATWKRLLLLSEAVVDQGAVLQEFQLNKEREQVADMLQRMDEGQVRPTSACVCVHVCCSGKSNMQYDSAGAGG